MVRVTEDDTRRPSLLELSNGSVLKGEAIGAPVVASGQMVFTTGMVGYSEALTDPSYFGQILVFTYPLIGNYGIPQRPKGIDSQMPRGFESVGIHTSGVVLTIDSEEAFHWNSISSLDQWLKEEKIPCLVGVDTRHLVHLIRQNPQLLGRIKPEEPEGARRYNGLNFQQGADNFFDPAQFEVIRAVSSKERKIFSGPLTPKKTKSRIALLDCGVKWNIIRQLLDLNCEVEVVPWDSDLTTVDCSGWLLSNGPGDPTKTGTLTERVKGILTSDLPVLGICLGHQILALSIGAKTKRMTYGNRSHNQPVYEVGTRKGYMTSQNHGYEVDEASLPEGWRPWFKNANDQSNEGIRHVTKFQKSVQFHPEASGGPRDTHWILEEFVKETLSCR